MASAFLLQPTPTITPFRPRIATDRVGVRRAALMALDGMVRAQLQAAAPAGAQIDLTVYERVYRRSTAGGHWTAARRNAGFAGHSFNNLSVALHFDEQDRPQHFVISGARDVVTEDATPEALARGFAALGAGASLTTWSPNFMPGVSL